MEKTYVMNEEPRQVIGPNGEVMSYKEWLEYVKSEREN